MRGTQKFLLPSKVIMILNKGKVRGDEKQFLVEVEERGRKYA